MKTARRVRKERKKKERFDSLFLCWFSAKARSGTVIRAGTIRSLFIFYPIPPILLHPHHIIIAAGSPDPRLISRRYNRSRRTRVGDQGSDRRAGGSGRWRFVSLILLFLPCTFKFLQFVHKPRRTNSRKGRG